jgi:hypothetical protein
MREGGVRLFRDYLGAWMIPQSGIGGEKSKLAQARLQEVCCLFAPFAQRLHPSPSLSEPIWEIRGSNV